MFLLDKYSWDVRTRMYLDKDTKKKNRGIFAKRDIPAGIVIGDYLGLLIPTAKEDDYENGSEIYLMYYDDNTSIWPDPASVGIHLLNHSCEANCAMYTYHGHTLFFALRKIHKGEEFTIAYQLSPIDDDCEPCIHACLCKASSCTGTWHMSNEKYDAWRTFDDKETAKTKPIAAEVKKPLSFLDNYPETIPDNAIYKLFGAANKKPHVCTEKKLLRLKTIRKLIRESGRQLYFPKLNMTVLGTEGKSVTVTTI